MKRLILLALASGAVAGRAWAGEFVNLELRVTPAGHELRAARRFTAPPVSADAWTVTSGPQLGWQLLDERGRVLSSGAVSDPRVLRGPLEPGKGHATLLLPAVDYVLRVPADAQAVDLRLMPLAKGPAGPNRPTAQAANGEGGAGIPAQRIDVSGVMRGAPAAAKAPGLNGPKPVR